MKERLCDGNLLYEAYRESIKSSKWKSSVHKYNVDVLMNLSEILEKMESGTYKTGKRSAFLLNERGKTRAIYGNTIEDRVIRHVLCDDILEKELLKYLIYDNGASQEGKGVSFARERLKCHLQRYYRKHGNKGYVLLIDYSKYYDNIRHDVAYSQIADKISDPDVLQLLATILDGMKVDVSFLTDRQYAVCMDHKFDSVKYHCIPNEKMTGEKFMRKSISIGDQTSQVIGILYPYQIDNYCKIVRGMKYYGRYMDDTYIISDSKEELWSLLDGVREWCNKLGIFINEKKTQICRIDRPFHFLQNSYFLTDTGKVVEKINKKRLKRMRDHLKGLRRKYDSGEVPLKDIENIYKSWIGSCHNIMSRIQIENMNALYCSLFNEPIAKERRNERENVQDHSGGRDSN